jgi:hypothetical protein
MQAAYSCALGESDESSSCSQRQRIRFVLKRRLHQNSIDSAFGRADCLAKKWCCLLRITSGGSPSPAEREKQNFLH